MELSELDLTSAEAKATYAEIREYVMEKFGLKVSQLYIAQVKREFGLIERINYNVSKNENAKSNERKKKQVSIFMYMEYHGMLMRCF